MAYIGNVPTTAAFPFDQFSGTGAQVAFALSQAPASTTSIAVTVSGVVQNPNTYSVSGATLTFTEAPPTGTDNIGVLFLGLPAIVGVPSDGVVTPAMLSTGGPSWDVTGASVITGTLTVNKAVRETRVNMAANNIDLAAGNYFTKVISTVTTLTVTNIPATGTTASFVLEIMNGGSASITWWSGTQWAAGIAPTFTVSGRDVLGFFTHDNGTTWTGLVLGKDIR